jgi:hypothetical protein
MKNSDSLIFLEILQQVKKLPEAEPFLSPVPYKKLGLLDYPKIIKHPMDLNTLERRVKFGFVKEKEEFIKELNLIWLNCFLYNQDGSDIYLQAEKMKRESEKLMNFYFGKAKNNVSEITSAKDNKCFNVKNHFNTHSATKTNEKSQTENGKKEKLDDSENKNYELIYYKRLYLNDLVASLDNRYFEEMIKMILKQNREACEMDAKSSKLFVNLDDLTLSTIENLINYCKEKQLEI